MALLRQAGHVIFIRHAATEATQDNPRPDLADPSTQWNLSDGGRNHARPLGRAIRRLQIPVGTVLAGARLPRLQPPGSDGTLGGRGRVSGLHPGDAGGPSLVARITAEEWQSLAQQG